MFKARTRNPEVGDSGFGIIEIILSMFLLALIAMAFLPLLMQSLRVSVSNSTLATATQLVAQQMEELRALDPTCTTIQTYVSQTNADFEAAKFDANGQELQPRISPITCPAEPPLVTIRVWVTDSTNKTLSEATTLVLVK